MHCPPLSLTLNKHGVLPPFRRCVAHAATRDLHPKSRIKWPAISDSSVRVRCLAKTVSRRVDEEAEGAKFCTGRCATCDGSWACIFSDGNLVVGSIRPTSAAPEPTGRHLDIGDAAAGGESRAAANSAGD